MRRYWTLLLLLLVYALSLVDRSVIGLLLDSIKQDMQVSDTVMGLVTGFGFAILYGIAGIPVAWWADRANRRNIISAGLVVFSLATSLSGFAANIYHLLVGRLFLAAGEAAQLAPSVSLLADEFPRRLRARAMAIFGTGPSIGIMFGLSLAGYLNARHGWQITLIVLGLPGMVLALLLRFTIREPLRGAQDDPAAARGRENPGGAIRFLFGQKSFWLMLGAAALNAWSLFGVTLWGPAFMGRVHQLGSAEIGLYFGIIYGVLGLCGALAGGFVSDYLGRVLENRKLYFPAAAAGLICPAMLLFLLADAVWLAVIGLGLVSFLANTLLGPTWAVMQSVSRISMRAMAAAIFQLMTNLMGMGLGPFLVGYLNDVFAAEHGDLAIRYSMLLLPVAALVSCALQFTASRYILRDVQRAAVADPAA